ncbi:MAG TPA: DegT/DnrJ/EryC1/StrS family aminotransferase [Candidatus Dormibacteraeota bacterium]|nr:DegT/DnrJ/EryC1/StrS family aminotransferase [Candidatus Dormibacteraeota bacterium]
MSVSAVPLRRSVRFVDIAAQMADLEPELLDAVAAVIRRGDFILGAEVAAFEREFAAYCEVPYAVGLDSGYSALELGLRALGVGPGDEVITQANTFIATASAILAVGARPVLADCDAEGACDPATFAAAVTPQTRALIPVHLFGRVADMPAVMAVAEKSDLLVVEDACQAHGARLAGRRAGSWGDASAFSFYPGKNLGALGDAGALVTSREDVAAQVRPLRHYGQRVKYVHEVSPSFNRRLDSIHAAALRVKLRRLDAWNSNRAAIAELYRLRLEGTPLELPARDDAGRHVFHLFVVGCDERDHLRQFLAECGIETGIHYPVPLHLQPALRSLGYEVGQFPNAERLAARSLSIPMFPEMSMDDVNAVVTAIGEFFNSSR